MRRTTVLILTLLLAACQPQSTSDATEATAPGHVGTYRLVSLNNKPLAGGATLMWEADGRISGEAPCNAYFARQTATAPAFRLADLGLTRRACLWAGDESAFVRAIQTVTAITSDTEGMTLTAPDGTALRFQRETRGPGPI